MTDIQTPSDTRETTPAGPDIWAPPDAPLDMPVQLLQRPGRRSFGLRLLPFFFPSDA